MNDVEKDEDDAIELDEEENQDIAEDEETSPNDPKLIKVDFKVCKGSFPKCEYFAIFDVDLSISHNTPYNFYKKVTNGKGLEPVTSHLLGDCSFNCTIDSTNVIYSLYSSF